MPDNQFSMDRIAARLEIQHRIYQFCRAVDRLDTEIARDAFHDDAFDNHGVYKGDREGLFDWINRRHTHLPFSYHHVGNIFIEFSGPDEAMVESYVLTWQSASSIGRLIQGGPKGSEHFEMLSAGRYVDRFTRRNGAWRIQEQISFPESTMVVPEPAEGKITFGPEWAQPARNASDPSQQLRQRLGLGGPVATGF